jgi:hypothetical protein
MCKNLFDSFDNAKKLDKAVFEAIITHDTLKGDIRLPVTLQQTVWVEYKRKCLFWKKVKAIHQTISSDNPYVDIKYSEYIQIDKK